MIMIINNRLMMRATASKYNGNLFIQSALLYLLRFCNIYTLTAVSKHNAQNYICNVFVIIHSSRLGGLVVSALDFQAGYRGFESRSGRDNFQTIITPCSYSTCPGLSIKWTGRRLVTDSGTKCARVIHESKALQIHPHHSNRRCLYVPRVPGSVKNPHNNNNNNSLKACFTHV